MLEILWGPEADDLSFRTCTGTHKPFGGAINYIQNFSVSLTFKEGQACLSIQE
jgi:hypothetical protein